MRFVELRGEREIDQFESYGTVAIAVEAGEFDVEAARRTGS